MYDTSFNFCGNSIVRSSPFKKSLECTRVSYDDSYKGMWRRISRLRYVTGDIPCYCFRAPPYSELLWAGAKFFFLLVSMCASLLLLLSTQRARSSCPSQFHFFKHIGENITHFDGFQISKKWLPWWCHMFRLFCDFLSMKSFINILTSKCTSPLFTSCCDTNKLLRLVCEALFGESICWQKSPGKFIKINTTSTHWHILHDFTFTLSSLC